MLRGLISKYWLPVQTATRYANRRGGGGGRGSVGGYAGRGNTVNTRPGNVHARYRVGGSVRPHKDLAYAPGAGAGSFDRGAMSYASRVRDAVGS